VNSYLRCGWSQTWSQGSRAFADPGPDQTHQIYSNRLKLFAVPCPQSSCHTSCCPSLFEEFLTKVKNLFEEHPPGLPGDKGDGGCKRFPLACPEL
jgi:hypothetical protein